ncbi:MAG: zinc ABC transporter substrate-binding protein, partial [Acidiferrobacterales bacterium]|nr:zinc ABC transporter substrate-binding protein [Acidiferrobacterales bacterium]
MEGIGTPELLLEGTYSVHGYQIKPSDVKLLENTDVMFWIGPTMESTLTSFISSMQEDTVVIEVGEMHGLLLYETRESPDGGHGDEDEDHHGEEEDDHGRAEGEDEDHHGEEEDDHGRAE